MIAPADVGQLVPTSSVAGESEVLLMVMVADGGSTVGCNTSACRVCVSIRGSVSKFNTAYLKRSHFSCVHTSRLEREEREG